MATTVDDLVKMGIIPGPSDPAPGDEGSSIDDLVSQGIIPPQSGTRPERSDTPVALQLPKA